MFIAIIQDKDDSKVFYDIRANDLIADTADNMLVLLQAFYNHAVKVRINHIFAFATPDALEELIKPSTSKEAFDDWLLDQDTRNHPLGHVEIMEITP